MILATLLIGFLLILPLVFSRPALADTPPFGDGNWYLSYTRHHSNSIRAAAREDLETSCSELRIAQAILKAHFFIIQSVQPRNWSDELRKNKSYLEKGCAPKGL